MPFSTDVNVPRDLEVQFPPICVGCDDSNEGETWAFSRRTASWWGFFTFWVGRKYTVVIPCCADCRVRLRRQRWGRDWYLLIAAAAVLFVVMPRLEGMDRHLKRLTMMGALIVTLAPSGVYALMRPPRFDLHVHSKDVDLEFADPRYAEIVRELNEDGGAVMGN